MEDNANNYRPDDVTVSVILPVYNVADYIGRCIESLKRQQLDGLEFIFVDDCSTDDSVKIIEAFAKEDRRVRLLSNKENAGAGITRNNGIEVANGKYLSFIDPDDWINDRFYETLYAIAEEGNHDIVKGTRVFIKEGEKPEEGTPGVLNKRFHRKRAPLFYLFTYEHQTAIYKRELFKDGNVRYGTSRNSQDTTFLLKVCWATEDIVITEDAVYYYLQRPGAATYGYSLRRSGRELDGIREKLAFLQTKPNTPFVCPYINNWLSVMISNFYYAIEDESLIETDIAGFIDRIREVVDGFDRRETLINTLPELEVLFTHLCPIPKIKRREEILPHDRVERWVDFFEIYSDEIKSSHYQGCVKSFRYFLSILVRSGKIKNKQEEVSFFMKQFSRLSAKQKAGLFFAGFRVFIPAVYEKIKGK